MLNTIISGAGSYIPEQEIENNSFIENPFCFDDGRRIQNDNKDVIEKFKNITGIQARRYVGKSQTCYKIASIAGERAIIDSKINRKDINSSGK